MDFYRHVIKRDADDAHAVWPVRLELEDEDRIPQRVRERLADGELRVEDEDALVVFAEAAVIATVASPGADFTLVSRRAPSADRRVRAPRAPSLRTALAHLAAALPASPSRRHPWRRAYNPRLAERAGHP